MEEMNTCGIRTNPLPEVTLLLLRLTACKIYLHIIEGDILKLIINDGYYYGLVWDSKKNRTITSSPDPKDGCSH